MVVISGFSETSNSLDACPIPRTGESDDKLRVDLHRDVTVLLIAEQRPTELGDQVEVVHHASLEEARGALLEGGFDCVVLPEDAGPEALSAVRTRAPQAPIVVNGRRDRGCLVHAIRDAIDCKRAELKLARRTTHDELTGLPNRTLFLDRLSLTLGRLERRSRTASVLFLSLARFETVNDRHGREVGDQLLVAVAERLEWLLRPGDTVARFGGAEFLLLCDDIASEEDAIALADRIGAELALPFEVASHTEVTVGASIGVAIAEDRSRSPEQLVRAADRAMLEAKRRGARWELAPAEAPAAAAAA
jgi:diguanylate cyclase (GGDEF)-like protein